RQSQRARRLPLRIQLLPDGRINVLPVITLLLPIRPVLPGLIKHDVQEVLVVPPRPRTPASVGDPDPFAVEIDEAIDALQVVHRCPNLSSGHRLHLRHYIVKRLAVVAIPRPVDGVACSHGTYGLVHPLALSRSDRLSTDKPLLTPWHQGSLFNNRSVDDLVVQRDRSVVIDSAPCIRQHLAQKIPVVVPFREVEELGSIGQDVHAMLVQPLLRLRTCSLLASSDLSACPPASNITEHKMRHAAGGKPFSRRPRTSSGKNETSRSAVSTGTPSQSAHSLRSTSACIGRPKS